MEAEHPALVDSHVHLDHVSEYHPERIRWLRERGVAAISWAFGHHIETVADLGTYLDRQRELLHEIAATGLGCRYLCGVHPRNIPPDLVPEAVRDLVLPRLDDPLCLGVGEIGLETGSTRETELLDAHLELLPEVIDRRQVFGLHTPRHDKARRTRQLLSVLRRHPDGVGHTVVDHCTPETAPWVLEAGCRVGITLSPVKSAPGEVEQILRDHPEAAGRILLNTDSGTEFFEDLVRWAAGSRLSPETRSRLCGENAREFFGLGRRGLNVPPLPADP